MRVQKLIVGAFVAVLVFCSAQKAQANSLVIGFSNMAGAGIVIDANRMISFPSSGLDFQVSSLTGYSDPVPTAGYVGSIGGSFSIGTTVTTSGAKTKSTVSNGGTFSIDDGAGGLFTANISSWIDITRVGQGDTLNQLGTINLTAFQYSGTDKNLIELLNSGSAAITLNFTSSCALATLSCPVSSTSYSGGVYATSAPEPSALLLLGSGLVGFALIGRRRFLVNRKNYLAVGSGFIAKGRIMRLQKLVLGVFVCLMFFGASAFAADVSFSFTGFPAMGTDPGSNILFSDGMFEFNPTAPGVDQFQIDDDANPTTLGGLTGRIEGQFAMNFLDPSDPNYDPTYAQVTSSNGQFVITDEDGNEFRATLNFADVYQDGLSGQIQLEADVNLTGLQYVVGSNSGLAELATHNDGSVHVDFSVVSSLNLLQLSQCTDSSSDECHSISFSGTLSSPGSVETPEPSSLYVLGAGLLVVAFLGRRQLLRANM